MPIMPPLAPLFEEELARRWAAGPRTLAELDPEFDRWLRRAHAQNRAGAVVVVLGGVLLLATLALCLLARGG